MAWYDHQGCAGHRHEIMNTSIEQTIDDFYDSDLESIVDGIINDVYSTNVDPLDPDYIRSVGELMSKAIYQAFNFNSDFANPNIDGDDLEFIRALRKNNYYFVGGKNKVMKQSFTDLLFDGNNLRSFNKFKQECQKVGLQFNKNYLKTEYQTATANAQSASDWNSFDDDDILRYDAVLDSRTRPSHARLNGLELTKSDRLWSVIAPQNSWNCRCRLLVVPNGEVNKLSAKVRNAYKKLVDKDFKFNPGTSGDLFPPNHPYLRVLSKEDKARIDGLMD